MPELDDGGTERPWPTPPPPLSFSTAASAGLASSSSASSQSRLHDFSLPSLSWGRNQRLIRNGTKLKFRTSFSSSSSAATAADTSSERRLKVAEEPHNKRRSPASPSPAAGAGVSFPSPLRRRTPQRAADREEEEEVEDDEGLEKFKANLIAQFRQAVDRIKLPPPAAATGEDREEQQGPSSTATAAAAAEASKPWNLRLRRAACNAPAPGTETGGRRQQQSQNGNQNHPSHPSAIVLPENNPPAPATAPAAKYSGRLRSEAPVKKERSKFSPVLSREEIEADFFCITGSKPPRRPRRRPKNVIRLLEGLYPGSWLTEVTEDLYKLP